MNGIRFLSILACVLILFSAFLACDNGDDDDDAIAGDDDAAGDDDTAGDDDVVGDDDATGDDDTGDDDIAGDDDTGDDDDDATFECNHAQGYREERATVHFVDLPEGEAVYVHTEADYSVLINGGPADPSDTVINYLKDEGVIALQEVVIGSILDEDIGEIPDILDEFGADIVRKTPAESTSAAYLAAMAKVSELDIPLVVNGAGDLIEWLGEKEKVLGPVFPFPENFTDRDKSLIIKFSAGRIDFLLAGSVTSVAEQATLNLVREEVCAEALKVSYHGAGDATSVPFLDGVDPEQAVIVAGWNNPQGFPAQTTVDKLNQRLVTFGVTANQGNMVWETDGWNLDFCVG